ncbi:hypothetical protein D3C73_1448350 [compost metagenome]
MGNRHDEILRPADQPPLHQIRPELPGELELFIDPDGFADIDRPVRLLRGIVELAQRGMSRTGIVPFVSTLFSRTCQPLEHFNFPVRRQLF